MIETIDQLALVRWITAGLKIPEVRSMHGDAAYLLGNMVAKYSLAASQYRISIEAQKHLKSIDIDLDASHSRSKFYGKKSQVIYEHSVPASVVRAQILQARPAEDMIRKILMQAGPVTILLRGEDKKLTAAGFRNSMPKEWVWGDDPFARYHEVGIYISDQPVTFIGKIKR